MFQEQASLQHSVMLHVESAPASPASSAQTVPAKSRSENAVLREHKVDPNDSFQKKLCCPGFTPDKWSCGSTVTDSSATRCTQQPALRLHSTHHWVPVWGLTASLTRATSFTDPPKSIREQSGLFALWSTPPSQDCCPAVQRSWALCITKLEVNCILGWVSVWKRWCFLLLGQISHFLDSSLFEQKTEVLFLTDLIPGALRGAPSTGGPAGKRSQVSTEPPLLHLAPPASTATTCEWQPLSQHCSKSINLTNYVINI